MHRYAFTLIATMLLCCDNSLGGKSAEPVLPTESPAKVSLHVSRYVLSTVHDYLVGNPQMDVIGAARLKKLKISSETNNPQAVDSNQEFMDALFGNTPRYQGFELYDQPSDPSIAGIAPDDFSGSPYQAKLGPVDYATMEDVFVKARKQMAESINNSGSASLFVQSAGKTLLSSKPSHRLVMLIGSDVAAVDATTTIGDPQGRKELTAALIAGRIYSRAQSGSSTNQVQRGVPVARADVRMDLGLTENQSDQVLGILDLAGPRWGPPSVADFRLKVNNALNKVLSPDQVDRLTQIRVQIAGLGAVLDEDIQQAIGLTSDQKAKIVGIGERAQRAQESLQEKQQASAMTREELSAAVKKNEASLNAELESLLTADQKVALKKLAGSKVFVPDPAVNRRGIGSDRVPQE